MLKFANENKFLDPFDMNNRKLLEAKSFFRVKS